MPDVVPAVLRAIVVDDEPLAREGLRLRLGWLPAVEVVAECGTASRAAEAINLLRPDVVFLDIQMPGLDGFGVLTDIERALLPAVIFVTAHADHALRAFRVGAFDYLVKPFDDETLGASVERARAYVRAVRDGGPPAAGSPPSARIVVREQGRVQYVDPAEITWVEADGDHVRVHAGRETLVLRTTMQAMEARLDPARFVRVHRSVIVAIETVRELRPYSRGEHLVVLADGTRVPLSRRYRARVERVLGAMPAGGPPPSP
jgi:two-component system, LytTR family, response regulator